MTPQGFVEVHIPGGNPERHELLEPRSLVGVGVGAAVRVSPASGFADVELEIQLKPDGVVVRSATQTQGAIIFEGAAVSVAEVPWGEEIFAKGVRLTFLGASTKRKGPNPVLLLVAPLVLLVAGFAAFQSLQADDTSAHEVEAPRLVDDDRPCVQANAQDAEHHAREVERAALAKEERFPFQAQDGVEAATLLGEARSCFATAAQEADRARVDAEFKQWSERLGQEYAALQLRLRVALDNDRQQDALGACQALEALLASRPDSPYRQWLSSVRREAENKVARPKG
ncbi:MAG: hypothetical protein ABI548_29050 [Polyangiaceae bacterium]